MDQARWRRRRDASMRRAWDDFVRSSRNGTFLFERAYMEYHADRFKDHSLVISNERDGFDSPRSIETASFTL